MLLSFAAYVGSYILLSLPAMEFGCIIKTSLGVSFILAAGFGCILNDRAIILAAGYGCILNDRAIILAAGHGCILNDRAIILAAEDGCILKDLSLLQGLGVLSEEESRQFPILSSSDYGRRQSLDVLDKKYVRVGTVKKEFYRSRGINV